MRKTHFILMVALGGLFAAPRAHADVDVRVQAVRLLSAMEGDAHRIAALLRTARASRSSTSVKCVDAYLSQIDTGVRHGRDDLAEIRAAVAVNDTRGVARAMRWLASRREAARNASFAADACVIPNAAQERDQTVVRIVAPRLPSDRDVFTR